MDMSNLTSHMSLPRASVAFSTLDTVLGKSASLAWLSDGGAGVRLKALPPILKRLPPASAAPCSAGSVTVPLTSVRHRAQNCPYTAGAAETILTTFLSPCWLPAVSLEYQVRIPPLSGGFHGVSKRTGGRKSRPARRRGMGK
jgi:hypothetical protein